ncbi:isochorismate synthase [Merismopedia glauca]|uniref:Isochorismate synthase n=1 Tax=Merismopedia glauca CCAP 1448/3 TaxID=1296344 RepID=A0A2T1C1V2_9CYAN|nr:isochorismate synthase [Merismopedia glauca]PSB02241.1 isochorismate synthase [Merismopedia glauca CCAP 1448/3]
MKLLEKVANYLYEAFARIFSANHDKYPEIGVQPYEGEPYEKRHASDR